MAREDQPPCTESTYSRRPSKKVRLPPGMEAGPAGRSLVECLNNIKILEENGIRFIAVTQGLIRISRIRRRGFCCVCWVPLRSSSGL